MKYAKVAFEDVTVGDELPPLVKGPIEQIQLTRYAGASGDFNPIHQDEAFARAAGMGGVRGGRNGEAVLPSEREVHAAALDLYIVNAAAPGKRRRSVHGAQLRTLRRDEREEDDGLIEEAIPQPGEATKPIGQRGRIGHDRRPVRRGGKQELTHDRPGVSRWLTREPSTGKLRRGEEFRQAQAVPNCEPAAHAATVSHEAARLVEEEVRQVTAG